MRFAAVSGLCASALALLVSTGCADNESSLYIHGIKHPEDDCTYEGDPEGLVRSRGFMDVALVREYFAVLLIGNQIVSRGDPDTLRTETSKIRIYEYDVTIIDANGDEVQSYTAPTSGFVDEDNEGTDVYGLASSVLIDSESAIAFAGQSVATSTFQEVVAAIKIRGRTLGGNEIESGEFTYPISICFGCSVFIPPGADDPVGGGFCDAADVEFEFVCTPGQDGITPCLQCRNSATPDPNDFCNPPDPSE